MLCTFVAFWDDVDVAEEVAVAVVFLANKFWKKLFKLVLSAVAVFNLVGVVRVWLLSVVDCVVAGVDSCGALVGIVKSS